MRQHRLHIATQLVCWHAIRFIPLWSGEVNMGVPKTGEDYTAIALENPYPGWDAQLTTYTGNLSSVDENGCVCFSRGTLGRVYRCVRDGDVLGHSVAAQTRKRQDQNQPQAHTRVYKIQKANCSHDQISEAQNRILEIGNWRALTLAESPVNFRIVGKPEVIEAATG
jgi:hypothetical protein